ncbi:MAG: PIN domain-containing protein [Chloroflexi bacterium]|nr:PIN domain-containing protein [Chloroflexota bacterium]
MLLVVPDTNVLYSDPFLENPLVRTIMAAEEDAGLKLAVPAVVVDELRSQVVDKLKKTIDQGTKASRDFAKLSGNSDRQTRFNVNKKQQKAVLVRFDKRIEQLEQDGRILKYPCISLSELARRSIQRQLPFQDRDRGMRDTIIWLTLKEFLRANTDKRILLVTNDAKAYLDDEKEDLHPSLKRELVEEAIPQDSVLVRRNLDRVKSDFVSSFLSDAEWVSIAIKNSAAIEFSDQDDTIALMAQDWMFEHTYVFEDSYVTSDHDSVEFEGLEGVFLDDVEETLDLGCGQVSVASVWTGEADLVGSLGGRG